MWARTIEFILGIWLGISWIIFNYNGNDFDLLWNDFPCLILIAFFSLFSYQQRLRHLHLFNFLIGGWLFGFSYFVRRLGMDPYAQNYMFVSWLLLMLSIIPTHSHRPPYRWIQFMKNRSS
jgi:hypothetical protein